jgi:hypothetical protein
VKFRGEPTPETTKVTFTVQNFNSILPDAPAPVYVQASEGDVLDILFIRASDDNNVLNLGMDEFHAGCGNIMQDALFVETSLRYWHKQFNFWINPDVGTARDARCGDCHHILPENVRNGAVHPDIDFLALIHKSDQRDFTDGAAPHAFSAEVDLVFSSGQRSAFIHELGHAAFGLSDEYRGWNREATRHLPNNWKRKRDAKAVAPLRHKTEDDVRRIR